MKCKKISAVLSTLALMGTLALASTVGATTATSSAPPTTTTVPTTTVPAAAKAAAKKASEDERLKAMVRDLKITKKQAQNRIKVEKRATKLEKKLKKKLGKRYAGLWVSKNGKKIVVGVTTKKAAKTVRKAGATPKLVKRNLTALNKQSSKLRGTKASSRKNVSAWWTDPTTNKLVIQAKSKRAAERAIKAAGLSADSVAIEVSDVEYTPYRDYWGGDPLTGCTIAFAVHGGFLTAGHCVPSGAGAGHPLNTNLNGTRIGTVRAHQFGGGIDAAWATNEGGWNGAARVTHWNGGGGVDIKGSNEAPIGGHMCKSGMTTKWTCGYLQQKNITVNYNNGANPVVAHRASFCSGAGDSGGAVVWNDQAQGILSGGGGGGNDCFTVYQPLNPILQKWNLTLTTAGNGVTASAIQGWENKCIDVPSSQFVDGIQLQIWDCNGTNAQRVEFHPDGTMRIGGKCLDARWAWTHNGTEVQLMNCNGHAAQQFRLTSSLDLVNVHANKCVDVKDWGRNNGAKLQLWQCSGTANQKWWRK